MSSKNFGRQLPLPAKTEHGAPTERFAQMPLQEPQVFVPQLDCGFNSWRKAGSTKLFVSQSSVSAVSKTPSSVREGMVSEESTISAEAPMSRPGVGSAAKVAEANIRSSMDANRVIFFTMNLLISGSKGFLSLDEARGGIRRQDPSLPSATCAQPAVRPLHKGRPSP